MRILSGSTISEVLRNLSGQSAGELLDGLTSALAAYTAQKDDRGGTQQIHQPLRSSIVNTKQDTTLIMPVSNDTDTSVKVVMVPRYGEIKGAITVYDASGHLRGVLNAAEITAFRTALTTLALLTRWARPEHTKLAVFGSGKQAEWHIRLALLLLPEVQQVTVLNRGAPRLKDLDRLVLEELRLAYPRVSFRAVAQEANEKYNEQLPEILAEADIVCCCTPSREPLFPSTYLTTQPPRARFISLIGSYKPEMQEVDIQTLHLASQVLVDCKESCLEESGELKRAAYGPDDLIEIGNIFRNVDGAGRCLRAGHNITLFKCVGLGIMDLVISRALLDIAEDMGHGTSIESF